MESRSIVVLIFLGFALAELAAGRLFHARKTTRKDLILEAVSGTVLPLVVVPTIFTVVPWLMELGRPGCKDALSHWSGITMFAVLLVVDDLVQYAWHRLSHAVPVMYRLHRAHHSAEYMSVRIAYRNNLLYYAAMPNLWLSAALVHAGFGSVYAIYVVAKMVVVLGAHSSVPWDEPLWRRPGLRPLAWLLTHVVSTPTTHAAHHGKHASDGVTHYHGNFGNFLFVWDVMFGTAKISRRRPEAFGLERVEPKTWRQELLWPLSGRW